VGFFSHSLQVLLQEGFWRLFAKLDWCVAIPGNSLLIMNSIAFKVSISAIIQNVMVGI